MTYLINQANKIAYIVLAIFVFLIVVAFIFFLLSRKHKKKIKEADIDYSNFQRKDTVDYIKIDDIRDNMIITDNGNRFIGVIKCVGFDFYSEHPTVQYSTYNYFYGFINTINKPISYRQYTKPVDLEYTIIRYKKALDDVVSSLYNISEDTKDIVASLKTNANKLGVDEKKLYEKTIKENDRKIEALKFRKVHLEDQLRVLDIMSGSNVAPDIMETWVFEWSYDAFDFATELSKEDVEKRAITELDSIARSKIHALGGCGVKARRCNTEELIEMCRRYSSPKSSDCYKLKDIMESSFFEDIVTSNSGVEMIDASMDAIETDERLSNAAVLNDIVSDLYEEANKKLENVYKRAAMAEAKLAGNEIPANQTNVEDTSDSTGSDSAESDNTTQILTDDSDDGETEFFIEE